MQSIHQKIRTLLQLIFTPLLIIPVIFILFSPFLVFFLPYIDNAAYIFINTVFVFWIIVIMQAIFLGRTYCSHICPITGIFNFISYVKKDRSILSMEYPKLMGNIFLAIWIIAPLYVLLRNLGNLTGFLPSEEIYSKIIVNLYFLMFTISGILSYTFGKISVKHYACPFSSFMISANRLGKKLKLPSLNYKINKDLCKKCGKCTQKCLVNRDIPKLIKFDAIKFDECVQCGNCVECCRFSALTYTWNNK
jgi:ferredoxin-type protein NapH